MSRENEPGRSPAKNYGDRFNYRHAKRPAGSKMKRRIARGKMDRHDFRAVRVAHDAAEQHGRAKARRIVARSGSGGLPLLAKSSGAELVLPEEGLRKRREEPTR